MGIFDQLPWMQGASDDPSTIAGMGWLNTVNPPQASNDLWNRMRQQTPTVPPPGHEDDVIPEGAQSTVGGAIQLPPTTTVADAFRNSNVRPAQVTVTPEAASSNAQYVSPTGAPPQEQPAPSPRPSMVPQPAPSIMDHLRAGFANLSPGARQGGVLGMLTAAGEGLRTGQRIDPIGLQNQTARVLVDRFGFNPEEAITIAGNPQIMNQVFAQGFGLTPKQHVTRKDLLGNEELGSFDPATGRFSWPGGGGGSGSPSVTNMPIEIDPRTGRDEKFLAALSPIEKATVEGILNGDENAQGRNLQKFIPYAARAMPGFSMQDYITRLGVRKDMTSGQSSKELTAYDTMARHAEKLHKLVDEMDPEGWSNILPYFTAGPRNFILSQIDPKYQTLMGQFENLAGGIAAERAKALKGGNVAESDVNEGRAILGKARSKAQLHGAINEMFDMVNARIAAKEDAYKRNMRSATGIQEFMSPKARSLYQKFTGEEAAPAAVAPVSTKGQAAEAAAMPRFNSRDEMNAAVRSGKVRSGDKFIDDAGNVRQVP